jgi:hypothetical protein
MIAGPGDTLFAGYANGRVGLWSVVDGSRLYSGRVHGPASFLLARGETLVAASELGDHVTLDLSVLLQGYCDVLHEVWREIPVTWERGRAVAAAPRRDHPCAR